MKPGRPPAVRLTAVDQSLLRRNYLASNDSENAGSMTAAARTLAASNPELARVLDSRASKHSLPVAVTRSLATARKLVRVDREGSKALNHATYTPGRLRLTPCGTRRLLAGEQSSCDDGSVNFGVCVPWPWGGDRCSERFGVRLGRFQLLTLHDDATSYIPSWTYVIRPKQSYNARDVSSMLLRFCRDVCVPERFVLEGGSWQSKRVISALEALQVSFRNAKGRPNLKLVENYFDRLWTYLAIETQGQIGRHMHDDKLGQKLYVACQGGKQDPRQHFPLLDGALGALERVFRFLNTEPVESRTYGRWVPVERWIMDMSENPRPRAQGDHLWLCSPVLEQRRVRKGMVVVTAPGPFGLDTQFHFSSPDLWTHEGSDVRVAFDPLLAEPSAIIAEVDKPTVLCTAHCVDPHAMDTDKAVALAKAMRQMMRREYRVLLPDGRTGAQTVVVAETEHRTMDRSLEIRSGAGATPAPREAASASVEEASSRIQARTGEALIPSAPRTRPADLSSSLHRRARAQETTATAAW